MERLLRLERWLDASLTKAFARFFRSPVDPVEIAAALRRECDDKATTIKGGRILAPNEFVVEISTLDSERLDLDQLSHSLTDSIDTYAAERSYSFAGPVTIAIVSTATIESGLFTLRSTSLAMSISHSEPEDLWLEVGTRKIGLHPGTFAIGRDDSMSLRLEDPGVSRHHCDIEINGSTITVHDRHSMNGTLVDGVAVTSATVTAGSIIRVGSTDLILRHAGDHR